VIGSCADLRHVAPATNKLTVHSDLNQQTLGVFAERIPALHHGGANSALPRLFSPAKGFLEVSNKHWELHPKSEADSPDLDNIQSDCSPIA
jgi:hypothetical protein